MDYKVLFERISLPEEAVVLFWEMEAKKNSDPLLKEEIAKLLVLHGEDFETCHKNAVALAEKLEMPSCSFLLYIQLLLCEKAYDVYMKNGWDMDVYYDSMSDICVRIMRNYKEKKSEVVGIDNFQWLSGFVRPNPIYFKFGRLEYETFEIKTDFEYNGVQYKNGQKAMTIHIPSYLKFTHEACLESYEKAKIFFDKSLGLKDIPIICNSWMIHPNLQELLPADSAIAKFGRDFYIYGVTNEPAAPIQWVFGPYKEKPDDYPQNTTLQKNLVKWIKAGKPVGRGIGILKY
ncbi:MAG: hypothetical protein E7588_02860 [Ruminococcaceae bacterium]|nr:hypothetical protein [Oscillospiraceae bacterium]